MSEVLEILENLVTKEEKKSLFYSLLVIIFIIFVLIIYIVLNFSPRKENFPNFYNNSFENYIRKINNVGVRNLAKKITAKKVEVPDKLKLRKAPDLEKIQEIKNNRLKKGAFKISHVIR